MKKLCTLMAMVAINLFLFHQSSAQCTTTNLNWDYLDFHDPSFPQNTLAICQSQKFAFGSQQVTVINNYTVANILGENSTHTGEGSSYGVGADVQLKGDGLITATFQSSVTAVKFSVYDIDYNQRITVTALNGVTPVNITMAKVSGTNLTITGSGTTSAVATAGVTNAIDVSSTDGTINVDIAGPITSVTLTITQTGTKTNGSPSSQEDGSFWVSDIQACSSNSFSSNYRIVSQPWTGMPSYVLAVRNNNIYYLNPATGNATFLFQDPGHTNINSMAYDPVNRYLYYTYSLTSSPATDKILRRYDYNMDTFGIVMNDVSTLGIVLYDNGVESGAASFYDGSLYMGIEGNGTGGGSGRESKIWKVDFNASNIPTAASQVYGIDGTNHDWGDIGVANGVLYDFDADAGNDNLYVVPLVSRAVTVYSNPSISPPKQTCIDWQENLYSMGNAGSSPSTGVIATYTASGTQGTNNTITLKGVAQSGSWGDGAEAFKPKVDFGDAPASYDPIALSPALNERDTSIRLGATIDIEWIKTSSSLADADGSDEDGVGTPIVFNQTGSTYYAQVSVYNNTGSNATLIGWLDYNNNGIFDTGEASTISTVGSSSVQQNITLNWLGISSTLTNGSYTYLRIRLTAAANGMTTANATGYFNNGETEDYRIYVSNIPLSVNMLSFDAKVTAAKKVQLNWSGIEKTGLVGYKIQRSNDNSTWNTINPIIASTSIGFKDYIFTDVNPLSGTSFYRLLIISNDGSTISPVRLVTIGEMAISLKVWPNPAVYTTTLTINNPNTEKNIHIHILNLDGVLVKEIKTFLTPGIHTIDIPILSTWPKGTYIIKIISSSGLITQKLIIQ